MRPDELQALIHLRLLPRLSDRRLRALLLEYRCARAVLRLGAQELGDAAVLARNTRPVLERVRRSLDVIDRLGVRVLAPGHTGYPRRLLHLPDPPCLLLARGRLELLQEECVAVVGSRRHTEYGAGAAERVARELAQAGLVVVSGLARGIDGIAHRAALARGTVAVLGCGIDVAYPREHAALTQRIAEEGLLLSEFPPGTPPLPHHFPQRNRIIAALVKAVVVIEATGDSGSLITARHALDLGRDVYAVPGPIGRDTSEGSNELIKEGAMLVTCAADVLAGLAGQGPIRAPRPRAAARARRRRKQRHARVAAAQLQLTCAGGAPPLPPADLGAAGDALFHALGAAPRHVDDLAASCHLPAGTALAELLALEIRGHARQHPGARFTRA